MKYHACLRGIWGYGALLALAIGATGAVYGEIGTVPGQGAVTEGGGAQTPPGGGRPDAQQPQLGTGNRGTGQRGSAGTTSVAPADIRSEVTGPGRVVGQVLAIDGDAYVLRDQHGSELTFRVDRETVLDGVINMGAKVAADVEADGRVSRVQQVP